MAKISNGNIAGRFKQRFESVAPRLGALLKDLSAEIQLRVGAGKGVEGQPLRPYSASYAAYKKERGRSGKVDLTLSGQMLGSMNSLTARQSGQTVGKIFFAADQAEKVIKNQRKRPFFGLAKKQRDSIRELIGEIIRGR